MRTRGTRQGWRETSDKLKAARSYFISAGHPTESVDRMLEQTPFREKQWLKASEEWQRLRQGKLSDDSLDGWLAETRLQPP